MSQRSEVEQAFIDVVDGQGIQDLVSHTGLSEQRCDEILDTFSRVLNNTQTPTEVVLGRTVNTLTERVKELELRIATADLLLRVNTPHMQVRAVLKDGA